MITVQQSSLPSNLEPLDLVDDYDFDSPLGFEPTDEDWASLLELEEEEEAEHGPITDLAGFIEDFVSFLREQETEAEHWLAAKLAELAGQVRFLGATTPEQFEARNQTMLRDSLSVRPSNRAGYYRAWDVVDGLGRVQPCTDLFDAMMYIQQRLA